jgi:hypothetical protein
MANLSRHWNGYIYGTNTGNVHVELRVEGENVSGVWHIYDREFGPSVYDVTGTFQNGHLATTGTPRTPPPGVQLGVVTSVADLSADGSLQGTWTSSLGTAGTFRLFPHDVSPTGTPITSARNVAEQMHSKSERLGTLRLYRRDLDELIAFVRRDFTGGRVIVTYKLHGNDVTVYAEDFLATYPSDTDLRFLKIQVQEPDAHGINKVVNVDLVAGGENVVRVQGVSESWVNGKTMVLVNQLRKYRRAVLSNYRRITGTLATIFVAAVLVVLPDVTPTYRRAVFVGAVLVVWLLALTIHRRFIPNTLIFSREKQPGFLSQWRASAGSIFLQLITALATAWLLLFFGPKAEDPPSEPVTQPSQQTQQPATK